MNNKIRNLTAISAYSLDSGTNGSTHDDHNDLGDWPEGGLEYLGSCPWCDSPLRHELYSGMTDLVFRCAPGRWTLWRCDECRSSYLDPRPNQATIHLAYQTYYTHTNIAGGSQKRRGWLALRNRLANGYRNVRYGTHFDNGLLIGHSLLRLLPRQQQTIDAEFRFLPHPRSTSTARLLDVGCGNGSFLALAAKAGWTCFGCDPDTSARRTAGGSGATIRAGSAEVWNDAAGSFDAITMHHVLEHVPDPVQTLRTLHRLLRPGGFLYLDLPNIGSLGHEIYSRHWRGLETPRHLSLPSFNKLNASLKKSGFVDIERYQRPGVFLDQCLKSARIEEGHDPYDFTSDITCRLPTPTQRSLSLQLSEKAEFLTITCRKAQA
jgi:2-polyprenyl-3-methyl-5-hydroxy-6-metoxy-1,4-benzoquinol methylase